VLIVLAFALLLFAPWPWNLIGFVVSMLLGVGELFLWNLTVRHRRVRVGAETMVGTRGVAISGCHPDGQVRVAGTIWNARCEAGVEPGQSVRVLGMDALTLTVEPVDDR
jgi:membrane protein implicated in regulation of membrane protease activity